MKTIGRFALLVIVLVVVVPAGAQARRPKIGVALSGGGAKGCAHVGVLRQLEKMHIPVDYIAGTSMGAVVGALYASGMTPDEIEKELTTIDWETVLSDATAFNHLTYRRKFEETRYPSTIEVGLRDGKIITPSGIRTGQKLSFLLSRYLLPHLDQPDFSKLPIPYTAVAADLETGDAVVLSHGDLAEAVRASMSIPGAFTPVPWEGKILVDGGVTMNVPVSVVRAMGADIVIAIDIAANLAPREKLNSTLGVVGQLSGFLTRRNMAPELATADVVLRPDITGYDTFDFGKAAEIVKLGDIEAIAKKDELVKYAIDPAEHEALVASRHVPRDRQVVVDDIRFEGLGFVDERLLRAQMVTTVGQPVNLDTLQKDVEWMYGRGDFIGIHAGLNDEAGKKVLVMRIQEKPWGPAYLRTGIGMETRYNSPAVFLLLNFTKRWVNNRGAEWRNDLEVGQDWAVETEFYQPRGYDKYGFLAGGARFDRRSLRLFDQGDAIGEYEVRRLTLRTEAGALLGTAGEARLGVFYRWNKAKVDVGLPSFPSVDEKEGGIRASVFVNTTDRPFFPVRGLRLGFEVTAPLESFGAEEGYVRSNLRTEVIGSWGRHVLSGVMSLQDTSSGTAPFYDQSILGGLSNLGGYRYGELVGPDAWLAGAGYRNRVTKIPGFSEGVYLGYVFEVGDVVDDLWDDGFDDTKTSNTFYAGMETSYGPVMLAVSKSEHQDVQYYVQVGRSF